MHWHSLLLHFECYSVPEISFHLLSEKMLNALAVRVNGCRERSCKRILSFIIENMIRHGLYQATGTGTWVLQRFFVKNSTMFAVSVQGHPCRITAGYVVTWQCWYGPGLPCAVQLLKAVQFLIVGKKFSHCIINFNLFVFSWCTSCFYSSLMERYCVF